MGTNIRPEVSWKNKYWIDRHRYYELKHFCLQYPTWVKARRHLDGLQKQPDAIGKIQVSDISDPTERCVESIEYYTKRIDMIEKAARDTDDYFGKYILLAVTEEGVSYNYLKYTLGMAGGKDLYYNFYRKFFWVLSNIRE